MRDMWALEKKLFNNDDNNIGKFQSSLMHHAFACQLTR